MSGAEIAAEVAAALGEVGEATGSDRLEALLIRPGAVDESTAPPTIGESTGFSFTAIVSKFTFSELQSGNVRSGDVKFTLEAGPTSPKTDDKIKVNGIRYEIEGFEALAPAGVILMWKVHARGGVPDTQTYPAA